MLLFSPGRRAPLLPEFPVFLCVNGVMSPTPHRAAGAWGGSLGTWGAQVHFSSKSSAAQALEDQAQVQIS
jgi:hypothetical protein